MQLEPLRRARRFNMMQLETFTEAQIVSMLKMHYSKGVRVRPCTAHRCCLPLRALARTALIPAHVLCSIFTWFSRLPSLLHIPACRLMPPATRPRRFAALLCHAPDAVLRPVQVLRVFGHNDGYGTTMPVQNPIQPKPGVFNEAALKRFDFVMNALAEVCCSFADRCCQGAPVSAHH